MYENGIYIVSNIMLTLLTWLSLPDIKTNCQSDSETVYLLVQGQQVVFLIADIHRGTIWTRAKSVGYYCGNRQLWVMRLLWEDTIVVMRLLLKDIIGGDKTTVERYNCG